MSQNIENIRNVAIIAHVDHIGGSAAQTERYLPFQSGDTGKSHGQRRY